MSDKIQTFKTSTQEEGNEEEEEDKDKQTRFSSSIIAKSTRS
jgi:hypothetical protein